jgi:hypothetical protein
MPPPVQLYTQPQDVFDLIGVAGVQLRLDDDLIATGRTICATADALPGAITISITPLKSPLLRGTVLEWAGGGMPAVVEAALTVTAPVGSTVLNVPPLPAQVNSAVSVNALATARDNGVNLAFAARLVKACQYGTDQVNLYCSARYDFDQLAQSWNANRWATALAAKWVCSRRGNVPPGTIMEDAKEAIEEMKQVQRNQLQISTIYTRTAAWPAIDALTIDLRYNYTRVRVEPQLSDPTPTQFGQLVDWNSAFSGVFEF